MNPKYALSEKVRGLKPSPIRKIMAKASEAKKKGIIVTDLSAGRPDFDTPVHIKQATIKAMNEGLVHYTSSPGIEKLREAICDYLQAEIQVSYDPSQIIVTMGATEAIYVALQSILNPGDEVLVPDPMYVYYSGWSFLSGAKCISVPLTKDDNFKLNGAQLEKFITPKTRAIILTSPHNPTGQVYDKEDLIKIGELSIKHDFIIITDDIYSRLIYDEIQYFNLAQIPRFKDNIIIIQSFSKCYAMDGWRIGYLVAPFPIVKETIKFHQHAVSCPNSFVQIGAIAALKGPQDCVDDMVREFDRRRQLLMSCMDDIGIDYVRPRGAFYLFPSIEKFGMDSEAFCDFIFDDAQVAIVPGIAFGKGGEGYIRMSFATSYDEIEKGMKRFKTSLEKL